MSRTTRALAVTALAGAVLAPAAASAAAERPIYVRPGAPGEPTRVISPASIAVPVARPYTHHEVHFLQHMLVHHGQAVTMSALVPTRASDERVHTMARRIDIAQEAEMAQMVQWLEQRDEDVPDPFDTHGHEDMPGMVSHHQMEALRAATGRAFDILFLELMIQHHLGAVEMVLELEAATGGALEADISSLAFEIVDSQETEIRRMQRLLDELRG